MGLAERLLTVSFQLKEGDTFRHFRYRSGLISGRDFAELIRVGVTGCDERGNDATAVDTDLV